MLVMKYMNTDVQFDIISMFDGQSYPQKYEKKGGVKSKTTTQDFITYILMV